MIDFPERKGLNLKSTDHSMGPGWRGSFVVKSMLEEGKKYGMEVLASHATSKILVDEDGTFTGIIADNPGGQVSIKAKCCILASGGFSRNREIMKKIRPAFYCKEGQPVNSFATASCTGDAIRMVEEIGGAIDLDTVKIPMFGPVHHPFTFTFVRMNQAPEMGRVNIEGKRYEDEGAPPDFSMEGIGEALPKKIAYGITNDKLIILLVNRMIEETACEPSLQKGFLKYGEQLEEELTWDQAVYKADTIGELARKAGIEEIALIEEIEKYNRFSRDSKDERQPIEKEK